MLIVLHDETVISLGINKVLFYSTTEVSQTDPLQDIASLRMSQKISRLIGNINIKRRSNQLSFQMERATPRQQVFRMHLFFFLLLYDLSFFLLLFPFLLLFKKQSPGSLNTADVHQSAFCMQSTYLTTEMGNLKRKQLRNEYIYIYILHTYITVCLDRHNEHCQTCQAR